MRILLVNPNTSQFMTDRMLEAAAAVAHPETRIKGITAKRGLPYISSRADAQIAGAILLELLAEHQSATDVAIIAAFGDPGLTAARELFAWPVVGMAEASMLTACMLGARFGIVTFSPLLRPWFADCVAMHGLSGRCTGIRTPAQHPRGDLDRLQDVYEDELVELARTSVRDDGADVVIFAGAPLAGMAAKVRARVPVPIVDQIVAALKQAETLAALDVMPASEGAFSRPPAKASVGLPRSLAEWLAHEEPVLNLAAIRSTVAVGGS